MITEAIRGKTMFMLRPMMRFHFIILTVFILMTRGQSPIGPCQLSPYRSADGSCNNLKHPTWGKSLGPYRRFLPPNYADGVSLPRVSRSKSPLPNARVVSDAVAQDWRRDSSHLTTMFSNWGLFINLETTNRGNVPGVNGGTLDCCGKDSRSPDCVSIMLPENDPFYASFRVTCLSLIRTTAFQGSPPSVFREQVNNVEAFISGSPIYGSTVKDAGQLRTFTNGQLRTTQGPKPTMALLPESSDQCDLVKCLLSGDARVNLSPELASVITLLMRHHNRLAEELRVINHSWTDERLYQESRRIIGAIIQLITYRDFLPLLLGPKYLKGMELELIPTGYYTGYSDDINPSTANVFGAAALRFGHSTLQHSYYRIDVNGRFQPSPPLSSTMLNPQELYQQKLDSIVHGLFEQKMAEVDQYYTEEVTDRLFEIRNKPGSGQDIFAINLQRGREHGLPSYSEWRKFCHLPRATSFDQLASAMPDKVARTFQRLYESVDDIDVYAAGVSEFHVQGATVGPTFACILGNQFRNSRRGDRFWFENGNHPGAFTPEQLNDIRKMSLTEIICVNTEAIMQASQNPFLVENKSVNCMNYRRPLLNAASWKEGSRPQRTTA